MGNPLVNHCIHLKSKIFLIQNLKFKIRTLKEFIKKKKTHVFQRFLRSQTQRERERERIKILSVGKRISRVGWRSKALTDSITRPLPPPSTLTKARRNPNHSSTHPFTSQKIIANSSLPWKLSLVKKNTNSH